MDCFASLAMTIGSTKSNSLARARGFARPENSAADPDVRRAELDRELEVGAHAHRQIPDPITLGDLREQREMRRSLLVNWRDAHQAVDGEAVFLARHRDEGVGVLRFDARLLRLGARSEE